MIDYCVQLIKFPAGKMHEAVVKNEDETYTIFLDKNDTWESQAKRYRHALKHLAEGDFDKEDVQQIEAEAHG